MRQLGSTLDKIAFEKAGIIKPDVQVISGALAPEAAAVIAEVAEQRDAPLAVLNRDFSLQLSQRGQASPSEPATVVPQVEFGVSGRIGTNEFEVPGIVLGLIGKHQQTNAAIAVAAIESLNHRGWGISASQLRNGLAAARLAGRTELVSQSPTVIIDIAHNEASIEALVETITELPAWQNSNFKTLIMAASREKDAEAMLRPVLNVFDRIVFTRYQDNPRGRAAEELLELARAMELRLMGGTEISRLKPREFLLSPTPEAAWQQVLATTSFDDFVCIAGSAFLVAELRPVVNQHNQRSQL
jgi:dihydrofolate synthase/folylpolyglutamate synthase